MSNLISTLDPNPYEPNECLNCGKETYNIEMGCWHCEEVYCVRCLKYCPHRSQETRIHELYSYIHEGGFWYKLLFLEKLQEYDSNKLEILLINIIEDYIIWRNSFV